MAFFCPLTRKERADPKPHHRRYCPPIITFFSIIFLCRELQLRKYQVSRFCSAQSRVEINTFLILRNRISFSLFFFFFSFSLFWHLGNSVPLPTNSSALQLYRQTRIHTHTHTHIGSSLLKPACQKRNPNRISLCNIYRHLLSIFPPSSSLLPFVTSLFLGTLQISLQLCCSLRTSYRTFHRILPPRICSITVIWNTFCAMASSANPSTTAVFYIGVWWHLPSFSLSLLSFIPFFLPLPVLFQWGILGKNYSVESSNLRLT